MLRKREDGFTVRKRGFDATSGILHLQEEDKAHLKAVMLDMFQDFRRVAARERIFYTMSGGSVLGTIRHGGFIPWDDDIDINIPRKDFEKLKRVFARELGDKYELCTPLLTKGHGMALAQMKKKGTICRSYNELSKPDALSGIAIDFFIIENVYDVEALRLVQGALSLAFGYLLSARKAYEDREVLEPYFKESEELRGMFATKIWVGSLVRFVPLDGLARLTARIYAMCKDSKSERVSIPTGRKHFFRETYPRSRVCERIPGQFEGLTVPIPREYDAYMEQLYGPGYMEIPPVDKQESHPIMELDFGEEG